jgi:hypothetical protein
MGMLQEHEKKVIEASGKSEADGWTPAGLDPDFFQVVKKFYRLQKEYRTITRGVADESRFLLDPPDWFNLEDRVLVLGL